MSTDTELIECKTVLAGNKKLTLDGPYLKSFKQEALSHDKRAVLLIELHGMRWALIPEEDYLEDRDSQ